MDAADGVLILGLLSMMAVSTSIYFLLKLDAARKESETRRRNGGIATYFLDDSDSEKRCEICFGKIGVESVAECGCGKIFHDACASPTEQCPYCGGSYGDMVSREPVRARCPVCGRFLKTSVCACGAVFPHRDGTFECSCGGKVDCGRPLCGKCGALYEKVRMCPDGKRKTSRKETESR
ncbi:MAG: hypothetical protein ACOX8L_01055 [Candidatus Methanomethylophilaceae archaeon]|jgi:hypothetical protein